MHDQSNCGLVDWLIDWLIDWRLMPTLAVFQLYHGGAIVNWLIFENKGSFATVVNLAFHNFNSVFMNNYYIVAEATKTRLCCSKIEVIAANFYDHHHELRNINLSNDNGYFLFYINFSFLYH
jgi:hypothetical protein